MTGPPQLQLVPWPVYSAAALAAAWRRRRRWRARDPTSRSSEVRQLAVDSADTVRAPIAECLLLKKEGPGHVRRHGSLTLLMTLTVVLLVAADSRQLTDSRHHPQRNTHNLMYLLSRSLDIIRSLEPGKLSSRGGRHLARTVTAALAIVVDDGFLL